MNSKVQTLIEHEVVRVDVRTNQLLSIRQQVNGSPSNVHCLWEEWNRECEKEYLGKSGEGIDSHHAYLRSRRTRTIILRAHESVEWNIKGQKETESDRSVLSLPRPKGKQLSSAGIAMS